MNGGTSLTILERLFSDLSGVSLTVLGGLISGLVGVGLFFLQRYKAGRDEQQRLLFRIYQLLVVPARPSAGEHPSVIAAHQNIAEQAQVEEAGSLAVRLKDLDLAAEVIRAPAMTLRDRHELAAKIRRRLHPKLMSLLNEKTVTQS